jgi:hypothetical protein
LLDYVPGVTLVTICSPARRHAADNEHRRLRARGKPPMID